MAPAPIMARRRTVHQFRHEHALEPGAHRAYGSLMRIASLLIVIMLITAACDRAPSGVTAAGGIRSEQFVDVYVKLMRTQNVPGSAANFEQRKQKVLKDAGVTEKQLQEFVQNHAADISMMAVVWDTIQTRIARASSAVPATME